MKHEVIARLSDRNIAHEKRFGKIYSSRKGAKSRCAMLVGILVVEILFVILVQRLTFQADNAFREIPAYEPLSKQETCNPPTDDSAAVESEEAVMPAPPSYKLTLKVTLRHGDTLFDILVKEGIPPRRIHHLVKAARPIHDLGRLRQGRAFTLVYDSRDGRILHFETAISPENLLVVEWQGDRLEARKETFEYETRHRVAGCDIRGSLFLAANHAGLPDLLILSLAEIFAWDIDFNVDIREGDAFKVLFEEQYLDGCLTRYGDILAAKLINRGELFWAFYFEGSDGRSDYYDREGRSLQKLFLKSPLKYTRISSEFSYRRFHPILKIFRPHLGVDYAAPAGTPVHALGDGRLVYMGRKGGYGRYAAIRHNGTYTSTYGHLKRYAKGLRRGQYVRQGQIIGYVGSTGLSTGPHLDFRLLKNGRFINPLEVNFPNADPVGKKDRADFRRVVERRMREIEDDGPILTQLHDHLRP